MKLFLVPKLNKAYLFCLMIMMLAVAASNGISAPMQEKSSFELIEGDKIRYLIDAQNSLGIDDILEDTRTWQENLQQTPSYGFTPHSYWFRFTLPVYESEKLLVLGYALLDEVELFRVQEGRILEQYQTGDRLAFVERPTIHRHFVFPLAQSNADEEIYLKVRSTSAIQVPIALWETKAFYQEEQNRLAIHGVYYGIVLLMALFNLFLFIRLKDPVYAFYVAYVVTFALTQMSISGFSYQFLWSGSPLWNQQSVAILTPLIIVFASLFIDHFLKLKEYHPLLHRTVKAQVWIAAGVSGLSLVLPYESAIKLGASLAIITSLVILILSYYVTFKSAYKYAIYFSSAWTLFLFGTVILAMNKFGVLPRTMLTEFSAQLGSAIEMILLALALVERLNDAIVRRFKAETESLRVNHELMQFQQKQNEKLEKQVSQRTEELTQALDEVRQLNDELVDLSTTDQLTGLRNRRFFDDHLEKEFKRAKRHQTQIAVVLIDLDHFKKVNDSYGHVAGDDCLRQISATLLNSLKRPQDMACRYGGEELALILPQTSREGVLALCEELRVRIESTPMRSQGASFHVTASMGVSVTIPGQLITPQTIIEYADQALYQAKESGRNQVQEYKTENGVE